MPGVSSTTPPICASPSAPAPRRCATWAFRTRNCSANHGVMFMVRRIEVDYLRPARLDDSLTVVTEPLAVGGATATLRQAVRGPEGLCATLVVRLACVKPGDGKPGRLPQRWRSVLTDMCKAAAAARDKE